MGSFNWVKRFFLFFVFIISSIGVFNYIINPYNLFNHGFVYDFNYLKTKVISDRMTKFYEFKHMEPKTVLMGSSRIGMIPNRYVEPYVKQPIYNLALAGSSVYEQALYLEYAIKHNDNLETIIWGLDFFGVNPAKNTINIELEDRVNKYLYFDDYITSLFSAKTFRKSVSTIKENKKSKEKYSKYYSDLQYKHTRIKSYDEDTIKKNIQTTLSAYEKGKFFLGDKRLKNPSNITQYILLIKNIVQLADAKNITLYIILNPVYSQHIDLYHKMDLQESLQYWKDELATFTDYYDFITYNSFTTNHMNFRDSAHINPHMATLVFGRIFGDNNVEIPSDFGILVEKR